MHFNCSIKREEYEPGVLFESKGFGGYFQVADDETEEWLVEKGYDGNGYTLLGIIDSLCRLELVDDKDKYQMEAEADNAWVYGPDQSAIERLITKFEEHTSNEETLQRLFDNADDDMIY